MAGLVLACPGHPRGSAGARPTVVSEPAAEALKQAPFKANWKKRAGIVRHGFTHFELEIEVYAADVTKRPDVPGKWTSDLANAALPTVMPPQT